MAENLEKLILELLRYPSELPWLEFKHDNYGRKIACLLSSCMRPVRTRRISDEQYAKKSLWPWGIILWDGITDHKGSCGEKVY